MNGTNLLIERIEITLRDDIDHDRLCIYIDVFDSSLSRRWLDAVIEVVRKGLHLEKNYCFMGFPDSARHGEYLCRQINGSIAAINQSDLGYQIRDDFQLDGLLAAGTVGDGLPGLRLRHDRLNRLHRYFEDLQGNSGNMSVFYQRADAATRWHIRQLNLLCHEFETWSLSHRKAAYAREWVRPSQLMCWLNAPRFELQPEDHELFGIDSLYRDHGGVYVGVNKAIGKHHWEVFKDEGRDSRVGELTTSSLRSQTEAAADFDIEWAKDTRGHPWMRQELDEFRQWLIANGFDPDDAALTIGHPKVGQVNLADSFGGYDLFGVWHKLSQHLDVYSIAVAGTKAIYEYRWQDHNYMQQQIQAIGGN